MGSISCAGVKVKVENTQLEPPPMRVTSTAVLVGTTQDVPRQQILSQNGYGANGIMMMMMMMMVMMIMVMMMVIVI